MNKNNTIKCTISLLLVICAIILPFGSIFTVHASALSVTDLPGTEMNGAKVLTDADKYLQAKSYITDLDNGFNTADSSAGYALSKDGVGTAFASFYIDTLGEGGSVLKGALQYNGYDAYGFIAGSGEPIYREDEETKEDILVGYNSVVIKLKYNYASNNGLVGTDGKTWDICDDSWKSTINGMSGVGVVGKGTVIVQKFVPTEEKSTPESANDWKRLNEFSKEETDGLHTVDFFNHYSPENHQDPFVVYTPSGDDLQKGVYIKLTVAYELVHTEKTGWWIFSGEEKTYKNIVEETVFYLCNTSGEVVFENLYYESGSSDETETTDSNTTSAEQKGGAISNNQGAIDGFRVDMRGWNYDVTYRYNDSTNALPCTDGQVFLDVGKYDFIIKSKIGVVRNKTVYIHEKTNTKNIEVYFGDNLVSSDSIRIFAPSETYPVYVKDTVTLQTKDENASLVKHAPLVGKVYLLDGEWDSVERDSNGLPVNGLIAEKTAENHTWSFSNLPSGKYEAVFVNNEEYFSDTDTGDTYKFVWRFTVVEEGQAPIVNEELLYQQIGFSDYESIHYVAKLPTKGTGNVFVVFTDEASAYEFACKYLVSTVAVDNTVYNFDGVSYADEATMLEALHTQARTLVEKRYYDATNVNTYLTLKDSILTPVLNDNPTEEELKEYNSFIGILNREYDYDILVFLSEESRENAAIGEPFLNDRIYAYIDEDGDIRTETNPIYFISVSDFESSSITIYLEGSDIFYSVPYGVAVQAFLESKNAPTGRYRIVESNPSGTTEYHAVYIRPGENTTEIAFERIYNNNSITHTLSTIGEGLRFRANNFKIVDIYNEFDPYGIIKIKKNRRRNSHISN